MSLDLKKQFITQLIESSRFLRNYVDHRAKSRGTTRAQWIVLFRLREQEGLSQVDLADVLELQPISLVRLLDRLVEHGLVERRSDPRDRRANRLFLTASGRQLADDLDSLRDAIATDVLQGVPAATVETSLKAIARRQGADQVTRRACGRRRRQVSDERSHFEQLADTIIRHRWRKTCQAAGIFPDFSGIKLMLRLHVAHGRGRRMEFV